MSAPQTGKHINITFIEGCLIFTIDISYLLKDPWSSGLISERVSEQWLQDLRQKLNGWDRFVFSSPEFVESEYGKTDRAPRNTFAKRHAKRLLPLQMQITKPIKMTEKNLSFFTDSVRISPQGAFSMRVAYELRPGNILQAEEMIRDHNDMLVKVPNVLIKAIEKFVNLWNTSQIKVDLVIPPLNLLEEALHSYEIVDFDFTLNSGSTVEEVKSVKTLYKDDDTIPACELAAISSMSPVSVKALNNVRLYEFFKTDIGGRDDELWAINRDRMIRRHPDRKSIYNKAFFADIKTASEILICQRATFDFLEEWVSRQRKALIDQMLVYRALNDNKKNEFKAQFEKAMRITQLLIEPVILQKDVKHFFYVQAISNMIECLELKESNERSSHTLNDFARLIETVSGYNDADLSATLGHLQIELAKSAKRIGYVSIWITIVGVVLTLIQVYMVLRK